jgi:hypothetical protein
MHSPRIADLPFHFDKDLTPKEQRLLEEYCFNDVAETVRLFHTLREAIELRQTMSEEYDIDLRSKSDAQIAEAILKKAIGLGKASGIIPIEARYTAPEWIKTKNEQILDLIQNMENTHFSLDHKGAPIEPEWMQYPFELGNGFYKVGLGGLHSQQNKQKHFKATEEYEISDYDVTSYYPNLLMKIGDARFVEEYRKIYERRIAAKKGGDKRTADSLKIVTNATYGKLGSRFSPLYNPEMMLGVTLSGQLNMLCTIDELEQAGASILSANTDGIVVCALKYHREEIEKVFSRNSRITGFEWERTSYREIAMKDVNNYIAVKPDGSVKAKGLYGEPGVMEKKNPTMRVCSEAAAAYIAKGTKPETFVRRCKDIRKFVAVRNVTDGGEQSGVPFGRIARWYMTTDELPPLRYVKNGNKVPKTDGARLCLELPDALPADLDKDWYIKETYQILHDVGVYKG